VSSVALAVYRRDLAVQKTYRLSLIVMGLNTIAFAVGLFFFGHLVTDPSQLGDYSGGYFEFALVGLAVTTFAGVGLQSFSASLVAEQATGTIDLLLASPARRGGLLFGLFLVPFGLAVIEIAVLLGLGIGVFGTGLHFGSLLACLPVLLLTTATFAPVGIVAAGVLMIAKRGDPISGPFMQLTILLSGAVYPISVLPPVLRVLAYCIPATWGVKATRELLLGGGTFVDVLPEIAVLVAFVAVLLPLSLLAFRRCLNVARRHGLLGAY
jgi:ABC-2 type transport system permease protein